MATNIRQISPFAALALLVLSVAPASAHDRMDTREPQADAAPARLQHLVLYSGARLAFYGTETPAGSGCRDRQDSESHAAGERTKEPSS